MYWGGELYFSRFIMKDGSSTARNIKPHLPFLPEFQKIADGTQLPTEKRDIVWGNAFEQNLAAAWRDHNAENNLCHAVFSTPSTIYFPYFFWRTAFHTEADQIRESRDSGFKETQEMVSLRHLVSKPDVRRWARGRQKSLAWAHM